MQTSFCCPDNNLGGMDLVWGKYPRRMDLRGIGPDAGPNPFLL